MKVSCTTLACPDWSLETVLERFKEYGYDGVDFRGLGDEMQLWKLEAFSTDAEATARRVAEAHLEVTGFSSGARLYNPDPADAEAALEEVRQYARLCRIFSAPIIRVFGGRHQGTAWNEVLAAAAETLRKMAEIAGEGITIAVETHDDFTESSKVAEVIARTNAPNVGVLWDLHHPYRVAGESPQQTYDNIGRYTVATHLKDSRTTGTGEDDYEYVLAGEGDVPLAEMVRLLKAGGYDGAITLEWEKKWHPELAEPEVALPHHARYIRQLISQ